MKKDLVLNQYKDFVMYRNAWMGFAMLWVMCFHFGAGSVPVIGKLFSVGYGGVDIFFFASGIGCWYSLTKSPSNVAFLKRRASRIFPTYFPFIVVFIATMVIVSGHMTIQEMLGNIFCIGDLLGMKNQFNWYLGGLLIFYIIAPFGVEFVNQNINKKSNLFYMFLFLIFFSLCTVNHSTVIIVSTRMPIAYLGIVSAALGNKSTTLSKQNILGMLILSLCGVIWLSLNYKYFSDYLWSYGLNWYPFIFITPGLCYIISLLAQRIKVLNIALGTIGTYSFELYLLHLFFLTVLEDLKTAGFFSGKIYYIIKVAVLLFSFVCAYFMKKFVDWYMKFLKKASVA